MKPAMGGPANFDFHSPTVLSSSHPLADLSSLPPFHLFHGTEDKVVPVSSSVKLCEALKKANQHAELSVLEGIAHSDFILHLMDVRSHKHRELLALVFSDFSTTQIR